MNWATEWLDDAPGEGAVPDATSAPTGMDADPSSAAETETAGDQDIEMALPIPAAAGPSGVLVAGVCGGAGATCSALTLAAALGTAQVAVAAVDATADGGDLLERGYGEDVPAGEWVFSEGVLWGRRALGSPDGESLAAASTHALLGAAGYLPIYDAGSTLRARRLAPLLVDRALAIVLVVASRGDSVNRLPGQLEWIQSTLGEEALGSVVVVVASTRPGQTPVAEHLRAHLGNRVGAICEISHEASLASGGPVRWNELSEQIQGDFEQLAKTVRNVGDAWVARP
ncbi:hypothetical protein MWT96_24920 (plasmid) [Prescottella equi]|uniref:MinD-like ATPase involved in chromosome partitioning or flagellar assembly n=1 Tax=Rhodococcus hoagii TaxID=43767 RepID=A0A9Q2PRS0_RHOHA|nr:hypothetical protein [Prescottella equi]AVR64897.1 hypothetical protein pRERM180c [Prescottella equi]MBM4479813.1 hypothetical protein [Prescottella equi]MBM4487690.1 hypothetical protein [Prescottella equi]MBM4495169.1 hypothetical protein [Prescottella equi]MBM4498364.1 hypothetical protein [Prescottella equi]